MAGPLKLLIVNQHGENRGDEAAFQAMLRSFRARCDCETTVIGQFRARDFRFPGEDLGKVHYLNMVMSPMQGILLLWCTLLRILSLPPLAPNNSTAGKIMRAYSEADLVVSAPGGPYFGDIYRTHEPAHWLFVFLGSIHHKPVYIYAPSAGPFSGALYNFGRRRVYRRLRRIICRESQSACYIRDLDPGLDPVVTADSALQERAVTELGAAQAQLVPAWHGGERTVAISILRGPGLNEQQRELYEGAVRDAVRYLHGLGDYRFFFLPQLYGGHHSDVEYLTQFVSCLPEGIDASLLDEDLDSDAHRWVIARSDLVIASRYHPQVFAASARTPFVALCYQHKSSAFMHDIEMDDFAMDIAEVRSNHLIELVERCIAEPEAIRHRLDAGVQRKEALARKTTELILEDFERGR